MKVRSREIAAPSVSPKFPLTAHTSTNKPSKPTTAAVHAVCAISRHDAPGPRPAEVGRGALIAERLPAERGGDVEIDIREHGFAAKLSAVCDVNLLRRVPNF